MSVAHMIPRGDLVEHVVSEDCVCGPTPVLVPTGHRAWWDPQAVGDRWLYRHHPLDDREEP